MIFLTRSMPLLRTALLILMLGEDFKWTKRTLPVYGIYSPFEMKDTSCYLQFFSSPHWSLTHLSFPGSYLIPWSASAFQLRLQLQDRFHFTISAGFSLVLCYIVNLIGASQSIPYSQRGPETCTRALEEGAEILDSFPEAWRMNGSSWGYLKGKVRFCIFSVEILKNWLNETTHTVCGNRTR